MSSTITAVNVDGIQFDRNDFLGSGSFGSVYRGTYKGQSIAVKQIEKRSDGFPSIDELKVWQRLDHPNVVKLLHCASDDDFTFLALELCDASLDQVFLNQDDPRKYKGPALTNHFEVFSQLASGLEYIHSKNLVHGNIKPENILISVKPTDCGDKVTIKLSDFEFSKAVDERETFTTSGIKGGRLWFAPELLKMFGENLSLKKNSKEGDVFAEGLVFCYILIKERHVYGEDSHSIMENLKDNKPVYIDQIHENHWAPNLIEYMVIKPPDTRMTSKEVLVRLQYIKLRLVVEEENLLQEFAKPKSDFIEIINKFSQLGLDVNAKSQSKMNALHLLCRYNSTPNLTDAIRLLVELGIDVNAKDKLEKNALHYLCEYNSTPNLTDAIRLLVKLGIDVNAKADRGMNALHYFCQMHLKRRHDDSTDLTDAIQLLVKLGIDVNAKDDRGMNALHYFCQPQFWINYDAIILNDAIQLLVKRGIDVNAMDNSYKKAVNYLTEFRSKEWHYYGKREGPFVLDEAIRFLENAAITDFSKLKYGEYKHDRFKFVEEEEKLRQMHPQEFSSALTGISGVSIRGDNVNTKDKGKRNELHVLCESNSSSNLINEIQRLIEDGYKVNDKDKDGRNALHYLCQDNSNSNLVEAIKLFIDTGIDAKAKDNDEWNALHYLCRFNSSSDLRNAIQILIKHGIDANEKTNDGCNTLHLLCQNHSTSNFIDAIQILIQQGIDVKEKGKNGRNALFFLISNSSMDKHLKANVFRFLIRHGIQVHSENEESCNLYQDFFKENDNCGKICFDFLVKEEIRLGLHDACENCQQILSITESSRVRLQHHQMFSSCYGVFHLLMKHLEKWGKSNQRPGESELDMSKPTKWLREKAEQYRESETGKSFKEDFEVMADVSKQVKKGSNSSEFNCDHYERYLRSMYSIAEMTDAKESMGQNKWFYLLPFDFPIDYGDEKESDIKRAKMEWDRTLFSWAHKETDEYYGTFMKEDANDGFFLPKEFKHKCHEIDGKSQNHYDCDKFRVAADTCIGRSEFSEVVDTVTVRELNEDQEAFHEKEFLVSKAETYVGPKNEEEMDRSMKTEPAATSMSTSQQPIETKNAEAILLSTSHVVTSETPRKGWKAPDSTNVSMNEEPMLGMDQENEIGDHMTDDNDEDDCEVVSLEDDDGNDEISQVEEEKSNTAIEEHVRKMVVLEGGFQVGDLYDYRSDRILTDGRKYVESSKIGYPIKVNNKLSLEFKCSDSSTMNNKMENMGLDEHFQASFMAGLIEKPRGGSRYLTYCCSSTQAAQVLIFRVELKVTQLDLQNLAIPDVTHLYDTWKKTKSSKSKTNPTHIVVGVTYGAEAYCVLTQDLKDAETDDDSREEAEQFLSKIANQMENAIEEELNLAEFKQQFDMNEKKQLSNIKCYLYTDLQTGVVQECSVPDVYKHFLKFIQQVEKTGIGNNKSIPIAVSLCPLQAIMEHDEGGQFEFHDVDPELISRCARIWDELDQVCAKSVAIRTVNKKVDKSSLRQFEEAVGKYKSLMQTSLKKGIAKARETGQQSEIEKAAKITENHSIFKPSQLVQWLLYKQGECEMYEKISKMAKNLPLASKKTVEKKLGEALEMKYTLVLSLPCLEQRTNKTLQALKDYTDKYNTLVTYDDEENETDDNVEEESNMPWNQQTQKYVLSKVREFAEHVEKNKHLENQVKFFMNFCETDKDVGCRYSVYDATRLLKDNISQLPQPPTGLRVHAPKMSNPQKTNIVVAWDYAELGFPCYFLVEYRRCDGNDETWTQKKTTKPRETQITIPYKTRSAIEFRVAADTCIGRSEFSEVINTESEWDAVDDEETSSDTVSTYSEAGTADIRQRSEMRKTGTAASSQTSQSSTKNIRAAIKPPTDVEVETVTQSTAELGWVTSATENKSVSYRVRYWQYGQDESQANELEVAVGESDCRLEGLLPETTYKINIVAVSNGGREMSEPSETLHLTTVHQHVRFAETMVKRGIKIGDRNGMNLLAVPLTKSPRSNSTVERFAFGKESGSRTVLHKTILVMGATGAGKTTLINGMINYVFNVEWEDTFRFQLIHEQLVGSSKSQSQTSGITAYDIHHAEGFRVPYSLTIVDTPGYGDFDRDKEITEMIRKFFEDKSGIQNVDIIGFVAQAPLLRLRPTHIYIFDSVLSIFGNDVEENIDFLLTFADGQNPPILSAIAEAELPYPREPETGQPRHHKFNNSGFFCSNRESGSYASNTAEKFNRFFWRMGMENFQRFFSTLAAMKTKSLSLPKQVLEERRRLEATVDGLQPLIKIGLSKMEEMRKTKQMIANSEAQIDANQNVEIEIEVSVPQKVANERGYLTNCNKCYVTCHPNCAYANDKDKVNCAAMNFSMPAETRCCTVCPNKCIWNMHANQPYRWEYVKQKQTTSSDAIKEKYEVELRRKLTAKQLVEVLEKDVKANDNIVLQHVNTVTQCIKRLDEIALRPNPFSTPQYIDLIIDAEQQEKRQGYKERIESLKKLRKMAVITSKIKNNENLMSLDRKDDYEA